MARSTPPSTTKTGSSKRAAPAAGCVGIERVMGVLGRAWAGAVVQAMLDGNERFSELARAVPEVADSVLTSRLKELCEHGLTERLVEPGPPVVVRYRLTPAGRDAAPVLAAIVTYAAGHPTLFGTR